MGVGAFSWKQLFIVINMSGHVPAMARIESGSAFHVFAAKHRKGLRPCLVLLTLGNESMFVPLKLYFVYLYFE